MEFKRVPKNDSVPPKNCVMYPFTLQPEVGHSRDTGAIWPLGFVGYVVSAKIQHGFLPVKPFPVRKIPFSLLFFFVVLYDSSGHPQWLEVGSL